MEEAEEEADAANMQTWAEMRRQLRVLVLENAELKEENAKLKQQLPKPAVLDPKAMNKMFTVPLSPTEFGNALVKFKYDFDKNNSEVAQILGIPTGSVGSIKQWIEGHKCGKVDTHMATLRVWEAETRAGVEGAVGSGAAQEEQVGGGI